MKTIGLVLATKNPDQKFLQQALAIADFFDQVVIHLNNSEKAYLLPKDTNNIVTDIPCTAGEAFNQAIEMCNTDFILPICDDDFCDIEKLNLFLDMIKTQTMVADVYFSQCYVGNEKNGWQIWGDYGEINENQMKISNGIPFASVYSKDVWKSIGGYTNLPFNDWAFWLAALKKKFTFQYLDYPYYYFRQFYKEEKTLSEREFSEQEFNLTRKQIMDYIAGL